MATALINLVEPFDTAKAAAREIERRGLSDRHWMAYPDSRGQGVSALSGIEFERAERRCMESFIRWDFRGALGSPDRMTRYLEDEVRQRGRFYLLSDTNMSLYLPASLVQPIAHVPAGYDGYEFHLFVVGPKAAERPITLPRCVPRQRPFTQL